METPPLISGMMMRTCFGGILFSSVRLQGLNLKSRMPRFSVDSRSKQRHIKTALLSRIPS